MAKPEKVGAVWVAKATLYNTKKEIIAYCVDTPNGIAKAFMELPGSNVGFRDVFERITTQG